MEKQLEMLKEKCLAAETRDPVAFAVTLMQLDGVRMHGPEHHILDGAALLTALHGAGAEFDLSAALDELIRRGLTMPGASCGFWGMCGSASSVGAALSILHKTGPLSDDQYYKDNMELVSKALSRIAAVGGPRCCKRNAFLSLGTAVDFIKERCGIALEKREVRCPFTAKNPDCLKERCPFFPGRP